MPIPDTSMEHFQLVVKGEFAAMGHAIVTTANVLYYRRTSFPVTVNEAEIIAAFHAKAKANWKLATSTSWTWASTLVRCIDDAMDAGTVAVVGETGSIAGDCMPAFNAQLITKQSALRGRNYMGRLFVPSVPESGADGNSLTAGQLVLLDALAADLDDGLTDASGNTYVPFIFSASISQITDNPTTVNGADLTSCTAKDPIAVLRSRKSRT